MLALGLFAGSEMAVGLPSVDDMKGAVKDAVKEGVKEALTDAMKKEPEKI